MTNLDMRDTIRANAPKLLRSVDTVRLVNVTSDSAYNNHLVVMTVPATLKHIQCLH
jgi:hypothetical protein